MHRIARLAVVATAALGLAAPVAFAQAQGAGKPTIAIMSFNNNAFTSNAREYDGLSKGVADFLVTEMANNPNIRVIERDRLRCWARGGGVVDVGGGQGGSGHQEFCSTGPAIAIGRPRSASPQRACAGRGGSVSPIVRHICILYLRKI